MTLQKFFDENPRLALAFSGGCDSAYLLWAAVEAGADVQPYFVKTVFQPAFELEDARRLCAELKRPLKVLELELLSQPLIAANSPQRCYHCKRRLMEALRSAAAEDGYPLLIDGTNASDSSGDRPGMAALAELGVRSPLREAGLEKADVRRLSAEAGLFTADKPAYACLATRIPTGRAIDASALAVIEQAESLLAAMGYSNFRVRLRDYGALLQFEQGQLERAGEDFANICGCLGEMFRELCLDPEPRRKGD